jgi:hypothetical protein
VRTASWILVPLLLMLAACTAGTSQEHMDDSAASDPTTGERDTADERGNPDSDTASATPDEPADAPEEADTPPADGPLFAPPVRVGAFDAEIVPGASGLAASIRHPGLLYLLDDREGTNEVWVLDTEGGMLGSIAVDGLHALDTESLEVAPCGVPGDGPSESCLYVGDIGDNLRGRRDIRVYRFTEPDLAADPAADGHLATVQPDVAVLRYPDEAHDAEALLVEDGWLYVITKPPMDAVEATVLYRAPFGEETLERVGELRLPDPASPLLSLFVGNVTTGASMDGDGRVLLRTYDSVFLASPPEPSAGLDSLADWTFTETPTPRLPQAEAVTWSADECGYYTVSERIGDLWFVPCREITE